MARLDFHVCLFINRDCIVYHIDCTGRKYTLITDLNRISHNIHCDFWKIEILWPVKSAVSFLGNLNEVNSIDTGNFS